MENRLLNLLLSGVIAFVIGLRDSSANENPVAGSERALSKKTYTYKTVDKISIDADVYRPNDTVKRPVIVWLHGGALIMGSREGVPARLRELSLQEGFVLVSLDYRLAPEVKLPEIIEDLKDGLKWVRKSGPELFDANSSRMVVAGASAGGYLTMMSGISIQPPPTALVAYWGFGDVNGDWTTKPNEHYRKGTLITETDAWATVGKHVLTATDRSNGRARSKFFNYLKQNGLWAKVVSGIDPEIEREKIAAFCPIQHLSRNYPPILMLHGTADTDVPVEQSLNMARELKRLGASHELITIENGGHGLWGGDKELTDKAFNRSTQFIQEHLTKP